MGEEVVVQKKRVSMEVLFQDEKEEFEGQIKAWDLIHAFLVSKAAMHACKLGLPDMLAKAGVPLTLQEMASRLGSPSPNTDSLFSLVRYLCGKGFFSVVENSDSSREPIYGLTPVSKWLLQEPFNGELEVLSLLPMLQFMNDSAYACFWDYLSDSILHGAGKPSKEARRFHWQVAEQDPRFNQLFNSAMACSTNICMTALLKHYHGFADVTKLVDVGGGVGEAASRIVAHYPSIHAVNFDLPHVVASAPTYPGVEHIGGDMFETIPSGDTIFIKSVLHDWGDEECVKILKNCVKALPLENGKLIILEPILERDNPFNEGIIILDMIMAFTTKGKERTKEQWEAILMHAGLSICNIIKLPCIQYVIEAFPSKINYT